MKKIKIDLTVKADETSNYYNIPVPEYRKLLDENVRKEYKKSSPEIQREINLHEKNLATGLNLHNRINITSQSQCYITLKDHKEHFNTNPKCRLINTNKSQLGKISNCILKKINLQLRNLHNLNQWQSTQQPIKWFNNIVNKQSKWFLLFDVKDFLHPYLLIF